MTHQLLYSDNIHPSIEEIRAKRAPKVVGSDILLRQAEYGYDVGFFAAR
jgi:hypothetical protein